MRRSFLPSVILMLFITAAIAAPARLLAPPTLSVRVMRLLPTGRALAHLAITLRNDSPTTLDGFGFRVTVDGVDKAVYHHTRFLGYPIRPGGAVTIPLYNFWVVGAGHHTVTVRETFVVERHARATRVLYRLAPDVSVTKLIGVK